MQITLEDIKREFDMDYTQNQTTRIAAADDRVFAWISQWDSTMLDTSQLAYKGEFNIVRKATRDIMADLRNNQVQIDFDPKDESRKDGAEVLDGIYLASGAQNTSLESFDNAKQEAVDCGIGGWELYTEYESMRNGDRNQVICRKPIYEFNNNAFPDCNAKLLDKSDAKRWTILEPYSREGYQSLYKELTGEETEADPVNFASPQVSYVFPWVTGNQLFYVARHYRKYKVSDKILTLTDPIGHVLKLRESDLKEYMDELLEQGYVIDDEQTKKIKRWQVKCYICSGEEILKEYVIPGEHIPVVPMYGERAFVEGEEHWEGVIRLAKDPQRLRNFLMAYLGDTVARGSREKPIFGAEQIAGFEPMYELAGAENNLPYALQHLKDSQNNPLPMGPVGMIPGANLSPAMGALLDLSRQAVEDVANAGLPDDITDSDLPARAIELLQNRLDEQSLIYQHNYKFAIRFDAVVYASMAAEIFDSPRKMMIMLPDGTRKQTELMQTILDKETGELKTLNDLTNMEFEVTARIGQSYQNQKQKTRDTLREAAQEVRESDPQLHKAIIYKIIDMTDGVAMDDLREYGHKQLLIMGISKPETEEDEAFMQEAMNQPEQPDPNMVLAMAEQGKAQAQQMREMRLAELDKATIQNNDGKLQVDAFEAETKRQSVMVDAQKAGADIDLTRVKIQNTRADTIKKVHESFRARLSA